MGTPNRALDEAAMMEAFRRGWEQPKGEPPGFWVGRPHPPFTEVGKERFGVSKGVRL